MTDELNFNSLFVDQQPARRAPAGGVGDFRSGLAYLFTPEIELATAEPLMLSAKFEPMIFSTLISESPSVLPSENATPLLLLPLIATSMPKADPA